MGVDEIITLDDGKEYILLMESTRENGKYFLAVEAENGNPTENFEIFKEIVENDEFSVEEVDDDKLKEQLIDEFDYQFETEEEGVSE